MKRPWLLLLLVVVVLLVLVACGEGKEEPVPAPPLAVEEPAAAVPAQAEPAQEVPAEVRYRLVYEAEDQGSIQGEQVQSVAEGQDGTAVVAVPAEGYHFLGWSDGLAQPERSDRQVTSDLQVTARFAADQYTLIYTAGENGAIEGPSTQKVDHGKTATTVTAIPNEGFHFTGWSDGLTTVRRSDRNITADATYTAGFATNHYTLTYMPEGGGRIEGENPQSVTHGGSGSEVVAVAERGQHFTGWSDGVASAARTDVEVSNDLAVSALFAVRNYTVGGRVSGLVEGAEVVLQNNGGGDLTVNADGEFVFAAALLDGASYAVTVLSEPGSPKQACTVAYGVGRIEAADVTDIEVDCVLQTYKVGGKVSGLPEGDRIVLRNNGGDDLTVPADGAFLFSKPLDDGSDYAVSVQRHPARANWTCSVENAAGTLAGQDVMDVDVACFVDAVVQPTPGIGKVRLTWNAEDFDKVTYNLCRAREEITGLEAGACAQLRDGVLEAGVSSGHAASGLVNDVAYWFRLEVLHANERRTYSKPVKAIPFGGLNDSGIDWCADNMSNRGQDGSRMDRVAGCQELSGPLPGQDGHVGRDADARAGKLKKKGSGAAGFDFTRVCANGEPAGEGKCPPNPALGSGRNNWACTLDNVTGLLWEVKEEGGVRGVDHTYTWHNPDAAANGGDPGVADGGACAGSRCDTQAYVQAVNAQGLCGATDWRLPTRKELLSIIDNGRYAPALDTRFFPRAKSAYLWTSSPYADQVNSAWQVYSLYGEADPGNKSQANAVRLVRGRTVTFGLENR